MTPVHLVVPDAVDDPARPSGGNVYDRRLARGLAAAGRPVQEHVVPAGAPDALHDAVASIPRAAVVLVDGLVASAAPEVLVAQARRLRLVALVHMPVGDERERAVLEAARAVVATSRWSRRRLVDAHALPAEKVRVATPGVDAAEVTDGSAGGGALLCVAAVTPLKGHDVLMAALRRVADLAWRCECVGSLDRDPAFARDVRRRAPDGVSFPGPRTRSALDDGYAAADLVVLASRSEAFGMVATEALARGVPVIATAVGGLPEALGHAPDGTAPGLLVAPADPAALAAALRRWLGDPGLRSRLRRAARDRRPTLPTWSATTAAVAAVIADVGA